MKFKTLAAVMLFTLAACFSIEDVTGNTPIIDTQGVNLSRYEGDLAECQADEVQIAQKAGAGVGAVGGGAKGVVRGVSERDRVIKRCLMGRGYRVLN